MKNNLRISYKHQAISNIFKHFACLIFIFCNFLLLGACKNSNSKQQLKSKTEISQDNKNYLACVPASYNLGNFDKKQIEEYYNCRKNLYRQNLTSSQKSMDSDQLQKCQQEVKSKLLQQELNQKIVCRKKVYEQFPNSLCFENINDIEEARLHLQKAKLDADYVNSNNFPAIGIDDDVFGAAKEEKRQKPITKKQTPKGIYNIFDLNKLRYKYLSSCYQDVDDQIAKLNNVLTSQCDKQFK